MALATAAWRGLQVSSILLISALLLLLSIHHGRLGFGNQLSQNTLTNRQAISHPAPISRGHMSLPKSIALPFGRPDHTTNFSSNPEHHRLFERADPPANYAALICKGGQFLDAIKAAFEGSTPGISFPESELENGWTKTSEVDEEKMENIENIERRWKGTFDALFGGYPPASDIKPVILVQDKEYDTILDDHITEPTNAESQGIYYPNQELAMSAVSYSAAARLFDRNKRKPLTKAERDALLPTISRLSDLVWLAWTTVASNPERLRYFARDNITNDITRALMRYLFLRDKGQANSVVWPGLHYDGDSDEAKALLATPNGRATAWLLIDHGHQMEWRLKSRQLRVHIFAYAGDYCMLWDLEPQSPPKRSKRDHSIERPSKHQSDDSIQRLVKRGGKEDFDAAKKQGDVVYGEMEAAWAGCAKDVQDFDPKAFENGWTRKTDGKSLPDKVWQDVIKTVAGEEKAPTVATSFYVNVIHDKDFTNSLGQPTKFIKANVGLAMYDQHYIPSSSTIIVRQTRSPAYTVKKRLGATAPSSQEIASSLVPPLNRWSDATWTLWKEKGGGANLRYIGRDYIANPLTESVMNHIFAQHPSRDRKFPGLDFGMDSAEGRALLGTPNGLGAGRILIDRVGELGRRDLRIWIFEPREEYPCMFFDMKPMEVQARAVEDIDGLRTGLLSEAASREKKKLDEKRSGSTLRAVLRRDKSRSHARAHYKRYQPQSPALGDVSV